MNRLAHWKETSMWMDTWVAYTLMQEQISRADRDAHREHLLREARRFQARPVSPVVRLVARVVRVRALTRLIERTVTP